MINKKLTPFRWCMLQTFPFIEATFDAIDNYGLLCKIVEYVNKNINKTNELGIKVEELNNWFNNLDVQDEINKKLDEMAEDGTLNEIISSYLNSKAIFGYNTVEEMKQASNLINGSYAKTLGFYNINDNGGAFYKIRNITNNDIIDNATIIPMQTDNLIAELIIEDEMYIEQFGAKGDNETDDYNTFNIALNKCNKIKTLNKTYKLSQQLIIKDNKELLGNVDILGYTILNSIYGIKIAGTKITFKNIAIIGNNQENYGLYCCGRNEGGTVQGDNHFNQNIIENIIISNFNYGIYFNGVIWNNTFENIRINFCNYGMFNTDTYYIMTTVFNNIYFSGSKLYNVQFKKTNAKFNLCNFGISSIHTIQFLQNCNISIENSNFECDKYIEGNGVLIEITGKNLSLKNNAFKICCSANMSLFNTGSGVQNLSLEDNTYESTTLNNTANALVKIFSEQINGLINGCINIKQGNKDFPFNIETESRLPYGKYEFVKINNLIQTYSEINDTTKLEKGDFIYFHQTNSIKYFNGTDIVNI